MKDLIDTIFNPVIGWLDGIIEMIIKLSVPVGKGINFSYYLSPFYALGPYWSTFILTTFTLGGIYLIAYIISSQGGLFIKFKEFIKWW